MKIGCNMNLQIWTLSGDRGTSLLNSLCNNGGYTEQIHKRTRNKLVLVYMYSFVFRKDIEQKTVVTRIYKYGHYWVIAVYHYFHHPPFFLFLVYSFSFLLLLSFLLNGEK